MLKRDLNARFIRSWKGFFRPKEQWRFESGKWRSQTVWDEAQYRGFLADQLVRPVSLMYAAAQRKRWWAFRGEFYWEDEGLPSEEVKVLILDRIQQSRKRVERARARLSAGRGTGWAGREPVPDDVKVRVWQRDGGKCVRCGSQERLEFDHIIPLSSGGGNTERNIQLLCEKCNREKGGNLL